MRVSLLSDFDFKEYDEREGGGRRGTYSQPRPVHAWTPPKMRH